MAKGSSTTRSGGAATRSSSTNGQTEFRSLISSYTANVDRDFTSVANDFSATGAVGRLQGNTVNEAINAVSDAIRSINTVTTVTQLRQYDDRLGAARRQAISALEEKISILEHNAQLARGRSQQTYRQAIDNLNRARYEIESKTRDGAYNIQQEAKLEEWLIRNNRW